MAASGGTVAPMGARLLAVLLAACLAMAAACDRGDGGESPPPPTVPETLPPEPDTEECADLIDAALGLLQGRLDQIAGLDAELLADPDATLPPMPNLDALEGELEARSGELCADGELGRLTAPRLGELQPRGAIGDRYVTLLAERLGE